MLPQKGTPIPEILFFKFKMVNFNVVIISVVQVSHETNPDMGNSN